MPSPSPSPKRSPKKNSPKRPLHERSQSQANEISLRLVRDDPKSDVYSATPFPTKPAHVLRPKSHYGQGLFGFDEENGVSGFSNPTPSLGHVNIRKDATTRADNAPDSPTISNAQGLSLRELYSSQARPPALASPVALTGEHPEDDPQGSGTASRRQSDEVIILPNVPDATIKKIESYSSLPPPSTSSWDPSSPNLIPIGSSSSPNIVPLDGSSSPNVVPLDSSSPNIARIGRLSTPNIISIGRSSTPNLVTLGSSSPNYITTKISDSSISSSDSQGTVQRHRGPDEATRPSYSIFPTSSSARPSSQQYNSSPPGHGLRSYTSTSSLALPEAEHYPSRPSSAARTSSLRSHTDLQSILESDTLIQYPVVRPPQSSSWAEIHIPKRPPRLMTDKSSEHSGRWNPHLSTVPSEWSAERQLSLPSSMAVEDPSDAQSLPMVAGAPYLRGRDVTGSTIRIVDEADRTEASDSVTDLRPHELRTKASGFLSILSSDSRANSMKSSLRRPSSSGSLFPSWARAYYTRGNRDSIQSAQLSSISDSRPTTSASPATDHFPLGIFRPRTRPHQKQAQAAAPNRPRPDSLAISLADPRAHWAGAERAAMAEEERTRPWTRMANEWSPHLHHDHRVAHARRSMWKAPSVDEKGETFWSWRNAQVLSFIFGFIFPVLWFVAAVLPLPPKPTPTSDIEAMTSRPDLEATLEYRVGLVDEIRFENARWWRNLNRFMCAVGVVVIAVVITLAVIGTRMGGF